jgi:BirA family biotin operon repressor/biotin-[acetyl-CoA-carboxylase] ligase
MQIIKLNATDSTNTYLKELNRSKGLPDYAVVLAREQRKGRGQVQTSWISEPGKNLTFSVLKRFSAFPIEKGFLITVAISLAIFELLKLLNVPNLAIKWPNDIMSGSKKLCGVLIENSLANDHIKWTVIGIGLNVNQVQFIQGLNATSIRTVLGKVFHLDSLFQDLLAAIRGKLDVLEKMQWNDLYPKYQNVLFRYGVVSTFRDQDGILISGIILGVSPKGQLCLRLANNEVHYFSLKEVKLLS